jgi:hypothetical protein
VISMLWFLGEDVRGSVAGERVWAATRNTRKNQMGGCGWELTTRSFVLRRGCPPCCFDLTPPRYAKARKRTFAGAVSKQQGAADDGQAATIKRQRLTMASSPAAGTGVGSSSANTTPRAIANRYAAGLLGLPLVFFNVDVSSVFVGFGCCSWPVVHDSNTLRR